MKRKKKNVPITIEVSLEEEGLRKKVKIILVKILLKMDFSVFDVAAITDLPVQEIIDLQDKEK